MTLTLVHRETTPVKMAGKPRIMVLGPAAHGIAGALLRLQSRAEVIGVESIQEALACLNSGRFDHVLVDNRVECGLTLPIIQLGRSSKIETLTVLGDPSCCPDLRHIPGVDRVISPPYNPIEIAESLGIEIIDSRRKAFRRWRASSSSDFQTRFRSGLRRTLQHFGLAVDRIIGSALKRERLKRAAALAPGFTPVLSLIYKNVALIMLASLFLAFISYGVMIVYFLTSDGWSAPIQLQRGHELVGKAERERGELKVKRNLVIQQIADAQSKAERGRAAIRRAQKIAEIAGVTILQEIENRQQRLRLVQSEIEALHEVVRSYGPASKRIAEKQTLHRDFRRRIITRRIYESSLLNLAEIEKNVVTLQEQISRKRTEQVSLRQGIAYLGLLKRQLAAGDDSIPLAGGKAEFVPIANQIIEVQQVRAAGVADIADYDKIRKTLENSVEVLNYSITELENSPLIRALDEPVNVLFVPYANIGAHAAGAPLFTCAFAIFWCRNVGVVGHPIAGEVASVHPFFNKPIRGQFIEARLTEISAVRKEIFHVGRPPLFL